MNNISQVLFMTKLCHYLEPMSYLQGQGHIACAKFKFTVQKYKFVSGFSMGLNNISQLLSPAAVQTI